MAEVRPSVAEWEALPNTIRQGLVFVRAWNAEEQNEGR